MRHETKFCNKKRSRKALKPKLLRKEKEKEDIRRLKKAIVTEECTTKAIDDTEIATKTVIIIIGHRLIGRKVLGTTTTEIVDHHTDVITSHHRDADPDPDHHQYEIITAINALTD